MRGRGGLATGRQGVTDDWALSGIGPLSDWAPSQALGPYEGPNWKLGPAKILNSYLEPRAVHKANNVSFTTLTKSTNLKSRGQS